MADQLTTISQLSVPRYAPRPNALPIPEARWNDEPLFCLEVNDEWVSHILGVMSAMDQADTWQGDEDAIRDARQQVNEIMLAFMEVCMDCCGETEIAMKRVDENGHFQQSTDGGATWTDAPQLDPRNNIPQTPPYPPTDSDNSKCAYSDSIVQHFKTGFVDVVEEGSTVEELLAFLTGITEAIFGPLTGPIGWIIPALVAIATAVVAVGNTAFQAAFNDDVWNALRCLIFDNINADGSFSIAGLDAVYSNIDTVASDVIAQTTLRSWIAALGVTGMTNAAHLGKGSSTSCDDCSDVCPVEWTFYGVTDVVQDMDNPNIWHMNAVGNPTHIAFASGDIANGCYVDMPGTGYTWWPVGSASPVDPLDPRDTPVYNADFGGDLGAGAGGAIIFTFSRHPIAH